MTYFNRERENKREESADNDLNIFFVVFIFLYARVFLSGKRLRFILLSTLHAAFLHCRATRFHRCRRRRITLCSCSCMILVRGTCGLERSREFYGLPHVSIVLGWQQRLGLGAVSARYISRRYCVCVFVCICVCIYCGEYILTCCVMCCVLCGVLCTCVPAK